MRLLILLAAAAAALVLAGCGPVSATDDGGEKADPVALLTILPSPGNLRGDPAHSASATELAQAFSSTDDVELTKAITAQAPSAAAVRTWSDRNGTLVAAVSVWDSHLTATQVGADLAQRLVAAGGAAWTPSDAPGTRGATREGAPGRELRLARSVGPNALYVRATGNVSEETVITALQRLSLPLENNVTITRTG